MLEFIFFHPKPQQLFVDWLQAQNLAPESANEDGAYTVLLPEDIDDSLYATVEVKYEALLEMNEEIMKEENPDQADYHMAGITVQLQDGRTSYADIDPKLLGRVMQCISPEEFATIVSAIATAVEHPEERSYCQRQRDG